MRDLALLLLGWALGLAGGPLADWLRHRAEGRRVLRGVRGELEQLRARFALLALDAALRAGLAVDGAYLRWVRSSIAGAAVSGGGGETAAALAELEQVPDEELNRASEVLRSLRVDQVGLSGGFGTPYLDAHIGSLGLLPRAMQDLLLDLRWQLQALNQSLANTRKWLDLTFSALEPENRQRVDLNLGTSVKLTEDRARRLVDLIRQIERDVPGS